MVMQKISKSTARYKNGLVEGLYFTTDLNSDLYGFISLNKKLFQRKYIMCCNIA